MPIMTKDGQPLWRQQYESKKKYDAQNTIRFNMKLNKNTDADLIQSLETVKSKQGLIKQLLREYFRKK